MIKEKYASAFRAHAKSIELKILIGQLFAPCDGAQDLFNDLYYSKLIEGRAGRRFRQAILILGKKSVAAV